VAPQPCWSDRVRLMRSAWIAPNRKKDPMSNSHSTKIDARPRRMSRVAFDRLDPLERAALMKQGWTLFDEPKPMSPVALLHNQMRRSDFEKLDHRERMARMLGCLRLVD
jgi:hypothetical protein